VSRKLDAPPISCAQTNNSYDFIARPRMHCHDGYRRRLRSLLAQDRAGSTVRLLRHHAEAAALRVRSLSRRRKRNPLGFRPNLAFGESRRADRSRIASGGAASRRYCPRNARTVGYRLDMRSDSAVTSSPGDRAARRAAALFRDAQPHCFETRSRIVSRSAAALLRDVQPHCFKLPRSLMLKMFFSTPPENGRGLTW
jgi:hypothetical protein